MTMGKRLTTVLLVSWFTVSTAGLLWDAMRAIDSAMRMVGKTETAR